MKDSRFLMKDNMKDNVGHLCIELKSEGENNHCQI